MDNDDQQKDQKKNQAITTPVSLSQVLLAPLDAIFKAQIHAARSFLNMVLQLGYPHQPLGKDGMPTNEGGVQYNQEFYYDTVVDGKKQTLKVSIPALALVPVAPLAVESASFNLEMRVESLEQHTQIQKSEDEAVKNETQYGFNHEKRPWFLVTEPISIMGNLAPSGAERERPSANGVTIQIEIKVGKMPMPAGLNKLLTFMTESGYSTKGGVTS